MSFISFDSFSRKTVFFGDPKYVSRERRQTLRNQAIECHQILMGSSAWAETAHGESRLSFFFLEGLCPVDSTRESLGVPDVRESVEKLSASFPRSHIHFSPKNRSLKAGSLEPRPQKTRTPRCFKRFTSTRTSIETESMPVSMRSLKASKNCCGTKDANCRGRVPKVHLSRTCRSLPAEETPKNGRSAGFGRQSTNKVFVCSFCLPSFACLAMPDMFFFERNSMGGCCVARFVKQI